MTKGQARFDLLMVYTQIELTKKNINDLERELKTQRDYLAWYERRKEVITNSLTDSEIRATLSLTPQG